MVGEPGPKVRFGTTAVEGNGAIPAWKLLNRVTWKAGDTYDPHDVGTTQGRLYDFGVFSSVRLDLPETPTEIANVKMQVKPGKLYELRLGGGVGAELQRQQVRGRAELTINNFLGGLRKLRLRVRPGLRRHPFRLRRSAKGTRRRKRCPAHAARHLRKQRLPARAGRLRPRHRRGLSVLRPAGAAGRRSPVLPGTGPRRRLVELPVPQFLQRQRGRLQQRQRSVLRVPGPLSPRVISKSSSRSICATVPSTPATADSSGSTPSRAPRRSAARSVPEDRARSPALRAARPARGRRRARSGGLAPRPATARPARSPAGFRWAGRRATAGSGSVASPLRPSTRRAG